MKCWGCVASLCCWRTGRPARPRPRCAASCAACESHGQAVAAAPTPAVAAIAPATSSAAGARAAAPSARPPKYPKPSTLSARRPLSPSQPLLPSPLWPVLRHAPPPARGPASSRRRSTLSSRPMICGGGCGCGPGRGNTFMRTYSAASWRSWERKACRSCAHEVRCCLRSVGRAA